MIDEPKSSPHKFIFMTLFLVVGLSGGYYYLAKNYPSWVGRAKVDLKHNIFLRWENSPTATNQLPVFKLTLPVETIDHFHRLYKNYEDSGSRPYLTAYNTEYYQTHNLWKKGKLVVNNLAYRIKIRSHGRQPDNHRVGKFISFKVKLLNGRKLYGSRRMSFVIYQRVNSNADYAHFFAQQFGLFMGKYQLVSLQINDWKPKLYYIEHDLDDKALEQLGQSNLRALDRSSIFASVSAKGTPEEQEKQLATKWEATAKNLEQALKVQKISPQGKTELLARFTQLNQVVRDNDEIAMGDFFDEDYISSFEAARLTAGYSGHGLAASNLNLLYDTTSGKFFPVLHRDNFPWAFAPQPDFEYKMSFVNEYWTPVFSNHKLRLVNLLARNENIRQLKYQKAYQFLSQIPQHQTQMDDIFQRHSQYQGPATRLYEKLRGFKRFEWGIGTYWRDLKAQLEKSECEIAYSSQTTATSATMALPRSSSNNILLAIKPRSMAKIGFKQLQLRLTKGQSLGGKLTISLYRPGQRNLDFLQKIAVPVPPTSPNHLTPVAFDLAPHLKALTFFEALDTDSRRQVQTYYLLVETDGAQTIDLVKIKMQNFISGQDIGAEDLTLLPQKVSAETQQIRETIKGKISAQGNGEDRLRLTEQQCGAPDTIQPFLAAHQNLPFQTGRGCVLVLTAGQYLVSRDVILPQQFKLQIPAGTELRLGPKISIISYQGIDILGTPDKPVIIKAADSQRPFGTVATTGNKNQSTSNIQWLNLSGGSEQWIKGVFFSGALAIYNQLSTTITNSIISNNRADDGLNIKHSTVLVANNRFTKNFADQVDLDYCDGIVNHNNFINSGQDSNGDGLDVSGSNLIIWNNQFIKFQDKGISTGEESQVYLENNRIEGNNIGVAVKDSSRAFLYQNQLVGNKHQIIAYKKKNIFGGGTFFILNPQQEYDWQTYYIDVKSQGFVAELNGDKLNDYKKLIQQGQWAHFFSQLQSNITVSDLSENLAYYFKNLVNLK